MSFILLVVDDGLGMAVFFTGWMFSMGWNGRSSWNVLFFLADCAGMVWWL